MHDWERIEASDDYRRMLGWLVEHPDDRQAWDVFADYLEANGHPRGELIALDRALGVHGKGTDQSRALHHARSAVIARHRDCLLGRDALLGDLALHWRLGFPARAEVPNTHVRKDCLRVLREHPTGTFLEGLETTPAKLAEYLEASQAGAPVRELVLRQADARYGRFTALEDVATGEHALPTVPVPMECERTIDRISERLPRLRRLEVARGATVAIDGLRAPLESIEIDEGTVLGLGGFLAHRRLPRLVAHSVGSLDTLAGAAPATLALETELRGRSFIALGELAKRVPLQVLDLTRCRIAAADVAKLAALLQGSLRGVDVRLPPAVKRHERIKPLIR